MRRLLALGSVALLLVACSDDESSSTTTAPTTTAGADTSAPMAAAPAPLTPEVLCVANNGAGNEEPDYAFAYTNDATEPVVLADADSSVANGEAADMVFVTRVFAPGHVSPAFIITGDGSGAMPTWTIVGPDGESRTATPDASTPDCEDEGLLDTSTTDDPRTPIVEISDVAMNADATLAFTATLTGVDTSACPVGLEPGTPTVTWDDGIGTILSEGLSTQGTAESFSAAAPRNVYRSFLGVLVIDDCLFDGTSQQVWPGGVFESIYTGVYICIAEEAGVFTASTSQNDNECQGIPTTGGSRVRPA